MARLHRFATIQNVTDDGQTDDRQTRHCTIGSTDSTVGQKLHQDVDRCADELQCKLRAAEDEKTKTETRCVELRDQAGRLASFVEQCRQTIDSASAIELLTSGSKLRAEATKLFGEDIENDLCPNLRVIFTPTNLRQLLPRMDVNLVGTVYVNDAEVLDGDEDESQRFYGALAQNQEKG